jgi:DmsE family decaheme c-type cytochrome
MYATGRRRPRHLCIWSAVPALVALLFIGAARAAVAPADPQSSAAAAPPPSTQTQSPEAGSLAPSYVGTTVCEGCHQATTKEISGTMMGNILLKHPRDAVEQHGCEACHGPGSRYVPAMAVAMGKGVNPEAPVHGPPIEPSLLTFRPDAGELAEHQNAACLNCHERGAQAFWRASTHAFRGVACVDCHDVVHPKTSPYQLRGEFRANPINYTRPETQVCLKCHLDKANQINMPSHMPLREGLMVCTDCHNPHGGPYQHQLLQPTINEVCYTCHAEKRGPFLWAHPPVLQNCSNCHDPHGSTNKFLLKVSPPRLCQQCHVGTFHPGTPEGPGTVFVFGHSCTNCHANIHGSNAPGGLFLTR